MEKELTIEEKIGQMLIIALDENKISKKTINMIQKYKIGGIILYRKNYDNYQEMIELINKLKEINRVNPIPLFISIDQEGGRVNRMPPEILNISSPNNIKNTENTDLIKESANIIAKMLKQTGISINYSPVLDIKRFKGNHAIGDRCYGENKDEVSKYGIAFMKELMKEGILPVVKHFPGHGSTERDSHVLLPIIKKDIEILEQEDMKPFEQAVKEGAEGIMVGHMLIKNIDKKYPASLSEKIIKNYLIDKYNFQGLIITDDLKMKSMRMRYSAKKAIKLAINAGNNMIMIGIKYKTIQKAIKSVAKQVKKGKIEIDNINKSVEKIIKIKEKYNVNDERIDGFNIVDINKKIEELNSKI